MIQNVFWYSCKVPVILVGHLWKYFSRHNFENYISWKSV